MKNKLKQSFVMILLTLCMGAICISYNEFRCSPEYNHQPEKTEPHNTFMFKYALDHPEEDTGWDEPGIVDAICNYNYLTDQGVQNFVNDGYLHGYIDELIAAGRLPQGFTPTTATTTPPENAQPEAPEPAPTTPETSEQDSTPQAPNDNNNGETSTSPSQPEEKLTCDETVAGSYIVITFDAVGYEEPDSASDRVFALAIGGKISVHGLMSNGYYKASVNTSAMYVKEDKLIREDLYNAAWTETNRTDNTCSMEGTVYYFNNYSNLTKEEVLPVSDHDYKVVDEEKVTCTTDGYVKKVCSMCQKEVEEATPKLEHQAGEKEVVNEKTFFTNGVTEIKCLRCEEVLESKTDIAIAFPVIAGSILVIGGGIGAFLFLKKKKG